MKLASGAVMRIMRARGIEVACEAGHLWITEEGQPCDVWLAAGQRVTLVGDGLAVLEAKGDASLTLAGRS